jgi:Cdc6-like AAA superfamily ATPase
MSMELEAVIENFVQMLASDPSRSRQEIADLLNRWEEKGFISRQMRSVIIQRLKHIWDGTVTPSQDVEEK